MIGSKVAPLSMCVWAMTLLARGLAVACPSVPEWSASRAGSRLSTPLPNCDRSIAQAAPANAAKSAEHPRLILATTVLASSLAFVDGSVVNVGLPAIARSFPEQTIGVSWIVSGYLLPLSALLLIGGAAGDRFGHRRLLLAGVGLFLAASLLCALAPTLIMLLCGRVLQGIGAAMLMPTSLAILGVSFSGEARGQAIGIWASAGAAAGAIGPLVGGWLIDILGWRSMFLINLPIAIGALYFGARYIRDCPTKDLQSLDGLGALLATAGLTALTWGLTIGSENGGWSTSAIAGVGAGAIALTAFIIVERRRGTAAMMPLRLFASREFTGLSLLTFLLYGALGGMLVLLPYTLINLMQYSATEAGAALLPMPLIIALTAPMMGRLAARVGPRWPLSSGPVAVAAGFLLATRIPSGVSYWTSVLPAMLVLSLGMAGAVAPLTTAVLASVDPVHSGVASGLNSALARTGGLVATAFASAVLVSHGEKLSSTFRWAMLVGAATAIASGICAFMWLRKKESS
jgi:EmrB/QacA subfamily drug resistance transporter